MHGRRGKGWGSGGAMVLGKLPVPRRPTNYTPGIYAAGYIVFALTFVRSYVRSFVSSFVCSFVRYFPSRS